jgi:hypothetical protein
VVNEALFRNLSDRLRKTTKTGSWRSDIGSNRALVKDTVLLDLTLCILETSYQTIQRHIPEDDNLYALRLDEDLSFIFR